MRPAPSSPSTPSTPWPGPAPGPLPQPSLGPTVAVADEQRAVPVDAAHLGALARAVLVDQGAGGGELALTFVEEEAMAELNGRHLGEAGATDVLAFPLDACPDDPHELSDPEVPLLLGDVVVCPAVAERNALTRSSATGDELALLVVHGVLHVLGMDHAEPGEAAAMQAAERRLLARWHTGG